MDLYDDARTIADDLTELRRELHRHPEIGLDLPRTQELVLPSSTDSVWRSPPGAPPPRSPPCCAAAHRDDDDAPHGAAARRHGRAARWTRRPGVDFAATNGADARLRSRPAHRGAGRRRAAAERRIATDLRGDVVLMFQPGEEGWDGAGVMIDEGVLDAAGRRADAAYGAARVLLELPRAAGSPAARGR